MVLLFHCYRIFDEVITGFGRAGEAFGADAFGVQPDMMNIAKGLTNGAIPMGHLRRSSGPAIGLGGNGGAIKPSSGYAFAFIQKQIATAITSAKKRTHRIKIRPPHKSIDLWMDDVFVNVMKDWPDAAPNIFIRIARGLNGDEFALFLSGEATWSLRLKVIFMMPKWIFIRSFTRRLVGRYTGRLKSSA